MAVGLDVGIGVAVGVGVMKIRSYPRSQCSSTGTFLRRCMHVRDNISTDSLLGHLDTWSRSARGCLSG